MKKIVVLTVIVLMSAGNLLFSQEPKDSLEEISVYPQFSSFLSEEESWELHKEAFKKQLKSKGLSEKEIEVKMLDYEKQKQVLIEQMKVQREQAEEQRRLAEIQREQARELRKSASLQREQAEKMRQEAGVLRKQTEELRKLAEVQREESEVLRKHAEKLREESAVLREEAEEWRKSIKNVHRETIQFETIQSDEKSIKIKVEQKSTLFFNIDGVVNSGKVIIQLFDPNGKKEGELLLEDQQVFSSTSKRSNNVSGSLNKTINVSKKGEWLIKVISEKSESTINVSVAQRVKP